MNCAWQGGVAITGVRGMGGAGKTELARRLAAELKADYADASSNSISRA